jgi:hypothetical protein
MISAIVAALWPLTFLCLPLLKFVISMFYVGFLFDHIICDMIVIIWMILPFVSKKVAESLKSKVFSFQLHIYHCHGFLRDICIGVIPYKNSNSQVCVPVKQRGSFGNKYSFWSGYWQKNIQWQGDVIFCIFLYTIKDFS